MGHILTLLPNEQGRTRMWPSVFGARGRAFLPDCPVDYCRLPDIAFAAERSLHLTASNFGSLQRSHRPVDLSFSEIAEPSSIRSMVSTWAVFFLFCRVRYGKQHGARGYESKL